MTAEHWVWGGVCLCLVAHTALAFASWRSAAPETYVLTPYVEVVPGAAPLDKASADRLREELSGPVDARNIKHGYAWIGSTLSLQDLVSGIADLEHAGLPLTSDQRGSIAPLIDSTRATYGQMIAVQDEILVGEARLDEALRGIKDALPTEQRARVEATLEHRSGPQRPPPGGPPPDERSPPPPPTPGTTP
jgi:hypothetical protein